MYDASLAKTAPAAAWPQWLRASWLHPLNDRQALEELLASVDPMWSLGTVRARLLARRSESPDCCTLRLQPNRWWRGFAAGQHVGITVEIDGVLHQRVYSLSSGSQQRDWIEISVKRQNGGKVSNFLHDELPIGTIIELTQASGDFTLPAELPDSGLLLIAAGSGITPIMSLLRELNARITRLSKPCDITLIQISRDSQDRIFAAELDAMAACWPALRLMPWYTREQGRPTPAQLLAQAGDAPQGLAYLCGPAAFMTSVEQHWQSLRAAPPLRLERFGAPPAPVDDSAPLRQVHGNSAAQSFAARSGGALLSEAERAGLQPKYGCRIGICRTCQCRKRSGTVQDLVTGEVSSAPNEWIRLCVSSARSDLELDL